MKRLFISCMLSAALLAAGCGPRHDHHEHDHDHAHEHHDHDGHDHGAEGHDHAKETGAEHAGHQHDEAKSEAHGGEIIFTQAQAAAAIDFALDTVKPVTFYEVIPASGKILPAQGDEATVAASFSGILRFSSRKIATGTAVSKGETLFHISSREIAEGDYAARTEAAYRQAKAAYERAESLIGEKIISQADYETAKFNYETARAAHEALGTKTSQLGTATLAPLGGFIKNILVSEGQYVEVGQPLATVSQNRRLVLQAEVSMKYHAEIPKITGANFRTVYDQRTYSLGELNGRLLSAGKAADDNSAYLPLSFEFDNRGDILPGSYAEIFLTSSPVPGALTVPLTALTEEQGHYYVYVQLDEEGYRKQEVSPGESDGSRVRILSGLHAGEVIVSRGASLVKMAAFSGAIPHGHSH